MQITWKHILTFLICLAIGILIGISLKSCSKQDIIEPTIIHDTIIRVDTAIVTKTRVKYVTKTDTSIIFKTDTIVVEIPIEHKEYSDSVVTDSTRIAWNIQYSGYQAKIDTFNLDYSLKPQVQVIEKDRGWRSFIGIGVGIGGGIGIVDGHLERTPTAGIHIVYGWGYTFKRYKRK